MATPLPKSTWRLMIADPLPGPVNMARDSAILAAVEQGLVPPTLRLYRWDPPCLSLGYSQTVSDVDLQRLELRGWDLVRRPTGGRAILHADELTYAVIGPRSDPRLGGSLMDSYQRISSALFQALQNLGLPVEIHQGKNPLAHHQPVCFENPSSFEITLEGKKIIGSAQSRKKAGLLQHGSLPLNGDLTRITEVLHYSSPRERRQAAELLLEKAHTVSGFLGEIVTWEQASQSFIEAFQTALNLDLKQGSLISRELEIASQLTKTRYRKTTWTLGNHLKKAVR